MENNKVKTFKAFFYSCNKSQRNRSEIQLSYVMKVTFLVLRPKGFTPSHLHYMQWRDDNLVSSENATPEPTSILEDLLNFLLTG